MAVKSVLIYPKEESRLRRKSAAVKRLNADVKRLIQDLKETLAGQPGAGLAAPQIGVCQRVALVRFGQDEGQMQPPLALINPVITERGPLVRSFDGCLSIPRLYTWDSPRPSWLVFSARDECWNEITLRVEGADAVVVDHEVDHLDGVLFLDRLPKDATLYVPRKDENGEEKLVPLTSMIGG
jgi:peptide deformylase